MIYKGGTSRGAHIRALWELITDLMEDASPSKRARLRTHRALLERAYPAELTVNETDLAQHLAEEDGLPQED